MWMILKYAHFTDTPMTTSGVYLYYVQKISYFKCLKDFNPINLGLRLRYSVGKKILKNKLFRAFVLIFLF